MALADRVAKPNRIKVLFKGQIPALYEFIRTVTVPGAITFIRFYIFAREIALMALHHCAERQLTMM
nr:hypothetical protein [Citrobacter freundii]